MARSSLWFSIALSIVLALPQGIAAQSSPGAGEFAPAVVAVIEAPPDAPVGRPILLDGSASQVPEGEAQYLWFVEGKTDPISRTVDAIYTPDRAGFLNFRLVVRATVNGASVQDEKAHEVVVYRRKMVLIADNSVQQSKVESHVRAASGAGIFLKVLAFPEVANTVKSEERLARFLTTERQALEGAEAVVLWTNGISGLQPLTQAVRGDTARLEDLRNQTLVLVTNQRLSTAAQTARAAFSVLKPKRILLLHRDAVSSFFTSENVETFLRDAVERDAPVVALDQTTPTAPFWRPLTVLVTYMLSTGISGETVLLLLMLPVIATILSFLKQVIGMTTFGLFAPSIIALSFLALGWWVGLLFFLFIVITGYLTRAGLRNLHILYIPKVAIIISVVSITLLLLLAINARYGLVISRDTVFVLLIMSTLAESFVTAKSEGGLLSAISGTAQTLGAALICVLITQWPLLQGLSLAYPEVILITIFINVVIGRYTGLRLTEYFRFREVFRHMAQEE